MQSKSYAFKDGLAWNSEERTRLQMKKVRLAITGLGYMGRIHLRHCLRLEKAELAAVCDISRNALRYAKRMGVRKTYLDHRRMLKKESVDAVIIALPTFLHERYAVESAEAGKDILLEKPLARNVNEGKKILSAVERNAVRLMVGYPLRFDPSFIEARKEIKEGTLGDIESVYASFISSGPFFHRAERHQPRPVPDWWFSKNLTGGGSLIDLGCHLFNLLRWYLGEIANVASLLRYRFHLDVEDQAICLAQFESGSVALTNVGWFSQDYQLKVELNGTVGNTTVQRRKPNLFITVLKQLLTNTSDFWIPHIRELECFVECINDSAKPEPSGADALRDIEAIELAYSNPFSA